ncbi:MAG: DUF3850 domain-containing protein [Patescibacteria group bacterium]|nr:DUF3850 domain-containing protein [Patescibacteria group bacterium]
MAETHMLKIEHEYMDAIKRGEKPFEVRRNDRGFEKGDYLLLCRYGPDGFMNAAGAPLPEDSGDIDQVLARVTYILTGGQFGIEPEYVVMGIALCHAVEAAK